MRRFLDDITAERNALIAQSSPITKVQLLSLDQDTQDSVSQDECAISSTAATPNMPVTNDWVKVNSTTYGENSGGDGVFLIPSFETGDVQTYSIAGFTYTLIGTVSFEGDTGDRYDFTIAENGVPIGVLTTANGEGNNDPIGAVVYHQVNAAPANAVYSIMIRSQNAVDNVDIISCQLAVTIAPTNNP